MQSILEVLLGAMVLIIIMIIHGFGMYWVMHRFELNWPRLKLETSQIWHQILLGRLIFTMLCIHLFEIFIWSLLLYAIHAMPNLRTAFYFSAETYTTVGFGDVLLPPQWRQLVSLISISGLFAFGWTTGVLVKLVDKVYETKLTRIKNQH